MSRLTFFTLIACSFPEPDWSGKVCTGTCPVGYACARDARCVKLADVPQAGLCGRLRSNEGVSPGAGLRSCNARYQLGLTRSGVVLQDAEHGSVAIWSVEVNAAPGVTPCQLRMQSDGNLVLYGDDAQGQACGGGAIALWDTRTGTGYSRPGQGADLVLGDDGVARITDVAGVYWSTDGGRIPP